MYHQASGVPAGFLSTLPARGATEFAVFLHIAGRISIHAPREGSDLARSGRRRPLHPISIHAPREGSDRFRWIRGSRLCHFYPRSPRGERPEPASEPEQPAKFLSTLPARGATEQLDAYRALLDNFYPRSPRGERRPAGSPLLALLVISIHAPREGSDPGPAAQTGGLGHFYPRSPRGERPVAVQSCARTDTFLSTLPARGATAAAAAGCCTHPISIHAPREGSDPSSVLLLT